MKYRLIRAAWLALLFLSIICLGCEPDGSNGSSDGKSTEPQVNRGRVSDPETATLIAKLKEIAASLPRNTEEFQELNSRYVASLHGAGTLLTPVVQRRDFDQLCILINEVGHHDQYVDFLILFSLDIIVFPAPVTYVRFPASRDSDLADTLNEARLVLSDCIVQRLRHDAQFYEQYYWSMLWMRRLGLNDLSGIERLSATIDEMERADPAEKSWYCRNVFILAKLVDREELVDSLDCDRAVEVLATLRRWSREKYLFLRPHADRPTWTVSTRPVRTADYPLPQSSFEPPDRPFPEWRGQAPSFELVFGTEAYLKFGGP
jgi:hypothetical protein